MMTNPWTDQDTAAALSFWAKYQEEHDVTERKGQAVGIDPVRGEVWFGESALDIRNQMDAAGVDVNLLLLRVGYSHYLRK
jgi:hypothetical protein